MNLGDVPDPDVFREDAPKDYYELVQVGGARHIPYALIVELITVSKLGPVDLADKLNVSRPTERKIRKKALQWAGIPQPATARTVRVEGGRYVPVGDTPKAHAAARMIAEGASDAEVMRKLRVGYRRGKRIIEMAGQSGVVAMVASPEVMEGTVQASLDVMMEIVQANENIRQLSEWLNDKINELQEDTSHDADYIPLPGGEDGEERTIVSVKPFHERQKNLIQAIDVLRKLQETHLKAVRAQQSVLQDLFDLKQITQTIADIRQGTYDALAAIAVGGNLGIPPEEAMAQVADAIQRRFSMRKGIA